MNVQEVHNHLKAHNIKLLPHKVAIMHYLQNSYAHPTIDQIYNDLLPSMPTLSKTTVYNTLKLFCEKNAAISLHIDEKNVRYDGHTSFHAHFKCKKCGKIYDVPFENADTVQFKGSEDLHSEETQIYFLGKCKICNLAS